MCAKIIVKHTYKTVDPDQRLQRLKEIILSDIKRKQAGTGNG